MKPDWKFRLMNRGEINTDPIESEFFTIEHLDSVADALVRESIQNSLDAGIPGQPVHVAFRLFTEKSDRSGLMAQYLKGLHPHLTAEQNGLIRSFSPDDPENFLVIEDYGTRGLDGDPSQDDDLGEKGEKKNDFFYFWRNVGRSSGQSARGRWGLGKTVFQATSRINSFFGLTVRKGDNRTLLMGQAVLKTHLVKNQKYCPYGWFGLFDRDFSAPIEDKTFVENFSTHFGLSRLGKSGLSIVIPYPDPSINIKNLLSSVLLNYFFPILSGGLVVELNQDRKKRVINGQEIDGLINYADFSQSRLTKDDYKNLFSFTRWAHSVPSEDMVNIKPPTTTSAPKWDEELFEPEDLSKLREKFDNKERLAFRVSLKIKPKDHPSQNTFFDVFIEHDEKLERAEDHFIREGITIAGVSSLKQKGIRAVISIKDRALSAMLGDSENPAHTEWQERSPKFKDRYTHGASCLRFVKNSPKEIVRILNKLKLGVDPTPWGPFSMRISSDDLESCPKCGKAPCVCVGLQKTCPICGKKPCVCPTCPVCGEKPCICEGQSVEFLISRSKGGFRVRANPKASKVPQGVRIIVAYNVRGRDPFKKYSPFDFEVDKTPITVEVKGLSKTLKSRNQLVAQIDSPKFMVEVTGFDPERDLRVKVEKIEPQEP